MLQTEKLLLTNNIWTSRVLSKHDEKHPTNLTHHIDPATDPLTLIVMLPCTFDQHVELHLTSALDQTRERLQGTGVDMVAFVSTL